MRTGVCLTGLFVSGIALGLMGRLVAWLVPYHRETARIILGSEDRLPGLTKMLYDYAAPAAVVLLVLGVVVIGGGLVLLKLNRERFENFTLVALTVSLLLVGLVGAMAATGFVLPFVKIVVGVETSFYAPAVGFREMG